MSSCGRIEDNGAEEIMPRRKKPQEGFCARCKAVQGKIVIRHCIYCKECFLASVSLKFRKALGEVLNPSGQRKATRPAEDGKNLLLGFSGGIGSSILLDMIWSRYFSEPTENVVSPSSAGSRRRPSTWKSVKVAYIEQCGAHDDGVDRVDAVRQVLERYPDFELIVARLEDAFDPSKWDEESKPRDTFLSLPSFALIETGFPAEMTPAECLRSYLSALPTPTAVQHAVEILTRLLLQNLAHSTKSSHLLLGTSTTSLSIALISSISQGGGFNVKEERQETIRNLLVARPLREVGAKECAAWLWWRQLDVAPRRTSNKLIDRESKSIQQLTRDFIVGLERDFPSTVSTIFKTCEKLEPKGDAQGTCPLCQRASQSGIFEWKESIAIRSRVPSATNIVDPTTLVCYSCHTGLTSRNTRSTTTEKADVPVPMWVRGDRNSIPSAPPRILIPMSRDEMKDNVSEFLIDY